MHKSDKECEYSHSKKLVDAELARKKKIKEKRSASVSAAVAPTTQQPESSSLSTPAPEGGAPKLTPAQKKAAKAQAKTGAQSPSVPARVATVVSSVAAVSGSQVVQAAAAGASPVRKVLSLLLPIFCVNAPGASAPAILQTSQGTNLTDFTLTDKGTVSGTTMALPSMPRSSRWAQRTSSSTRPKSYTIEYINDSGAGRTLCSRRALESQGVPPKVISAAIGAASAPVKFDTAGGIKSVDKSVALTSSGLGVAEAYMLQDSPIAVSMGETVIKRGMPFIWIPPDLSYHVTDPSKVTVKCDSKYRRYAHRIEENVPIWREDIIVSSHRQGGAPILHW